METMTQVITETLVEKFGVSPADATPDSTFGSLDIDSLVLVEMSVILGDRFKIEVKEGELAEAQTIRQAAELVTAKLSTG
jgi:acyl carrier protein